MGKSPHIYFILWLLLCNMAFSQQREFITGRLLDATTEEPIVFASIRIKDRSLGVISNLDGDFKIPLVYKTYGDILEISSIGLREQRISDSGTFRGHRALTDLGTSGFWTFGNRGDGKKAKSWEFIRQTDRKKGHQGHTR